MVIRFAHEGSAGQPASIKTTELYGNRTKTKFHHTYLLNFVLVNDITMSACHNWLHRSSGLVVLILLTVLFIFNGVR